VLAEIKAILLEGIDLVGGYSCLHPVMQKAIDRINQIEGEPTL
jgi:PHP family Zn ribbon phosphoesterase